ncbi:S1/P1 nuclease [Microbulbifer sp. SAOS-129_SWC]|uniref:S1/P1 nuclease n=1 Tax=Microbulbifer sp. SAOS-129_SWC TaxID=3145235 RepID=UPI003216B44C
MLGKVMRGRQLWLVLLLLAAQNVFAWGADGHRVVGEIAWRYLHEDTRNTVTELLHSAGEPSLAEAATWADRIRSNPDYDWAAPLHYVSLPQQWHGYRAARDCPPAGCILEAIDHFSAVLAKPSATESARAEALLFLTHFVGDLHQPLHTGRATDRGGNDIAVSFFGFATNLHAVWDTAIPAGFILDWREYAAAQLAEITPQQRADWLASTPADWAAESHALAYRNAYTGKTVLGEDYYRRNRPVVEQRLRQAGVRLAGLIERSLSGEARN